MAIMAEEVVESLKRVSEDIRGTEQLRSRRLAAKRIELIAPITEAICVSRSVGVGVLPKASVNILLEGLTAFAGGEKNIYSIPAESTVQGKSLSQADADRLSYKIEQFLDEAGPDGIILLRGLAPFNQLPRGKGTEVVRNHLSNIAMWNRQLPDSNPVFPAIVGVGNITQPELGLMVANRVRSYAAGDGFTTWLDRHLTLNQDGIFEPYEIVLPNSSLRNTLDS